MNVTLDINLTPEEMRRLMGLPDVQEFNRQVMEKMLANLTAGAEGYDPMNIFQKSIISNNDFAKKWVDMMGVFSNKTGQ